jgi:hypothetical protein
MFPCSPTAPPSPHRRPVAMVNIEASRLSQKLRPATRNVPEEAIEPASTTATTASSSSSPVTGKIRTLQSSSGFREHAHNLLVSSPSFSPFSPSISD